MDEPENPFLLRASEQIENSSTFLRYFGIPAFDLLGQEMFVPKVTMFLSAPGGGKTTLLRIFTPQSLLKIYTNRKNAPYSELYRNLERLGVISSNAPEILGIYLRCTKNYTDIENLELESNIKSKLLFSLIGSRIILVALRGILELVEARADDLSKITITTQQDFGMSGLPSFPCTGKDLYDWAFKLETDISKTLNSLDDELPSNLPIFDFEFLSILKSENIQFENKSIVTKTIVMLDDLHVLNKDQRKELFEKLDSARPHIPIWLAQRKEALLFREMILGVTGRDFSFIEIEQELKSSFPNFAQSIANNRSLSSRLNVPFTECVSGNFDSPEWTNKFKKIIDEIKNRINQTIGDTKKYDLWFKQQDTIRSSRVDAILWRAIEILIARKERGGQQQLFDSPLPTDELTRLQEIKPAAELFISQDHKEIPYYCEFSKIVLLATSNIEQFLMICSALFEDAISNSILKRGSNVSLERQEKIIKKLALEYWAKIPNGIPYGENAFHLLENFCKLAQKETYRPTAPYLPGITGFGIEHGKYLDVINKKNQEKFPEYKVLEETLRSCIANNILLVKSDYNQGPKNSDSKIVFSLNRLICAAYDLPLGYGGFKNTNPTDLCKWLKPEARVIRDD